MPCYQHKGYDPGCEVCGHHPPPEWYEALRKSLRSSTVPGLCDEDGSGYPLIDMLTDDGGTVDQGIERAFEISDDAAFDLWHALKKDAALRSTVFAALNR